VDAFEAKALATDPTHPDTIPMSFTTSLTNHFLIAMPGLQDPNFARTVTYVCEHTEQGAMGIVINRPMDIRLGEMLDQLDITSSDRQVLDALVYLGGPVQPERGFVLHSAGEGFDSTLSITPEISVTTSRDVLEAIAEGKGPTHRLIALGYAGWGGGQLEEEMSANAWLSGPADEEIIFSLKADERWQAAAHLLGVDMNLLSGEAGHA
jgi:putative transcriptional regulator